MAPTGNRKFSYSAGSWALLAAAVGIIFIVNFFSDRAFTRLDLTRGQQFTLSPSTRDTLAKLPDIVTIKAYYSSNIPAPINQWTNEVQDLLHEYQVYGKGKVKLEIVDPAGDPAAQEEAGKLNINAVELPVVSMDQQSRIKIYASICVQYLDKSETIPNVVNTDTLEYDLTSVINRLASDKSTAIGLLSVDKDRKLRDEFQTLIQALEKEFKVDDVDLTKPMDNKDISVLLVLNPFHISPHDLFEIDQYLMRGGQAIILTDGVQVFLQPGQFGAPMPFYAMAMNEQYDTLGPMLQSYGVKRNYDLVMDKQQANYPILGPLGAPYALFPMIDMTKGQVEHQITHGIDYLVFTWASSLEVQSLPDTVKAVKLVVTSPEAWVQAGQQLMVDPMQKPLPPLPIPGMGPGERSLAVLLSGEFKSYFAGKPAPAVEGGDTAAPGPEPAERKDQSPSTNILVTGCSRFVSTQNPLRSEQSLSFIVSAAEWMTGGQRLADIRNRKAEVKPASLDSVAKFVVILGVAPFLAPLGIIVFGVARFTIKRSRRKKFLESVEP